MTSEEAAACAKRELTALAELFERIAGYYTEEEVAESRYTAGVRNTLRNCAHDARARASELEHGR